MEVETLEKANKIMEGIKDRKRYLTTLEVGYLQLFAGQAKLAVSAYITQQVKDLLVILLDEEVRILEDSLKEL